MVSTIFALLLSLPISALGLSLSGAVSDLETSACSPGSRAQSGLAP